MGTRLPDLERLFRALGDATRLRILGLLVAGEVCVCEIHDALRLPQPTVSRHLAYLRRERLVETRRDGLWVHYRLARLDDTVLRTLIDVATHALGHLDTIATDQARLERATGCCPKPAKALHVLPCCGGARR